MQLDVLFESDIAALLTNGSEDTGPYQSFNIMNLITRGRTQLSRVKTMKLNYLTYPS